MNSRKSIFEVIEQDENFSILLELLNKIGLGKAIRCEDDPYTFFAPTDRAFYRLFEQTSAFVSPAPEKILIAPILGRHLIPGVRLYTDDLRRKESLVTLEGNSLKIHREDRRIFVNDAQILTAGTPASNGIVFAVDKVFLVGRQKRFQRSH